VPLYEGLVTIKRGGKFHPPGTRHEFSEIEATALGAGCLRHLTDDVAPAPVATAAQDAGAAPAGLAPSGSEAPAQSSDGAPVSRVAEIADAIDLLNDDDFVSAGARAGKPKLAPLSAILGSKPEEAEIDAALALREQMKS
jgi:hypothetical protein